MFYTEIYPSALPIMTRPYGRTTPGCPMRMGTWAPETQARRTWAQPRRCRRRQPTYDDYLARLFECSSDSEDDESTETPTVDALLKALFHGSAANEKYPKNQCKGEEKTRIGTENKSKRQKSQETRLNSDNDDDKSPDVPTLDTLLKAFFHSLAAGENCSKSKCKDEEKPNTGTEKDTKCHKTRKDEKPSSEQSETKLVTSNDDSILATLNMRGYDPNSIEVKIAHEKNAVKILGKHAVFTPFGPMMRQNTHTVPIPECVSPKNIRSFISPDGVLYLKASAPVNSSENTTEDKVDTEKMDVETKSTLCTSDSDVVHNKTSTDDTEPAASTTVETENSPEENVSTEISHEENIATEITDATMDIEERETTKPDSESTTSESEHEFVVVEANSDETSDVTKATTADKATLDDVTNTDVENELTLAQLDMAGFSADDIKVNVNEEASIVELSAKREENTENGRFVREYYRAFPIPREISGNGLKTDLSSDGVFSIQATKNENALL